MLLTLGLFGLIPVGLAAFFLGRDGGITDKGVLVAGIIGLLLAVNVGLVPVAIVGVGTFLLGRGAAANASKRVVLMLGGGAVLAAPLALGALFYLASFAN